MNFNISKKKEYKLNENLTSELINLYGIQVKLLLVEFINEDITVFGDYSHIKTDSTKSFEIYGLPEVSEEWGDISSNFSDFGMVNNETLNLFISRKTIDSVFSDFDGNNGFSGILGNLVVLPNNRIMEITDFQYEVPGGSNLFAHNDTKNVYRLTLKTYNNKMADETTPDVLSHEDTDGDYETLDNYFNELVNAKTTVDTASEVTIQTDTDLPIVATDEDSVFGSF